MNPAVVSDSPLAAGVRAIRIADFDYELPPHRIAAHPSEPRDACRLLVSRPDGAILHRRFSDLPSLLAAESLMVCNNTRVINARIKFRKSTGAEIEIFCLEPQLPRDYALMFAARGLCRWNCLVGNLKRWKEGELSRTISLPDGSQATLRARNIAPASGSGRVVEFAWTPASLTFASVIEAAGFIPIPPYLNRASQKEDAVDYQTVYSKIKGSVAAPTAGLHFTEPLLRRLAEAGVERRELTLHVGAGTFQPVKSDRIGEHPMHTETFSISASLLRTLLQAAEQGRPLAAVGTTTVRTLESLPYMGRALMLRPSLATDELHVAQFEPYCGDEFSTAEALRALLARLEEEGRSELTASTSIMIAPGFRWRLTSQMVTNFHQPQSTLLLLVASFLSRRPGSSPEAWRDIYAQALAADYRFLSYGDSCLFL